MYFYYFYWSIDKTNIISYSEITSNPDDKPSLFVLRT